MINFLLLIVACVGVCQGTADTTTVSEPVLCGETPDTVCQGTADTTTVSEPVLCGETPDTVCQGTADTTTVSEPVLCGETPDTVCQGTADTTTVSEPVLCGETPDTVCHGTADTTTVSEPELCGETPDSVYSCLRNPRIFSGGIASECSELGPVSECERMTCVFRKYRFLSGENFNKTKIATYLRWFAADHPAWASEIHLIKTNCLTSDLPAMGIYLNCRAYDITHCALTTFIKAAKPSKWSTSPSCDYPRRWAASCPVCPSECLAPAVPIGSCFACRLPPQSP